MSRTLFLALAVVLAATSLLPDAHGGDDDRLFTETELASLDHENAMWRLVHVDQKVEANLTSRGRP